MKKLLFFALCTAFASLASAGSIQWNINMGRNGYIADYKGEKMAGDIYLILASSATALEEAAANNTFVTALANASLGDPIEITSGKNNNAVNTATQPSTILAVGTEYSFSIVVFDTANKQYYISSALSEKAYDESAAVVSPNKITFTTSEVGSTFNANWQTSVPEPSTAALALAGLALLLKRRKA
jgi:hypothetical protein